MPEAVLASVLPRKNKYICDSERISSLSQPNAAIHSATNANMKPLGKNHNTTTKRKYSNSTGDAQQIVISSIELNPKNRSDETSGHCRIT